MAGEGCTLTYVLTEDIRSLVTGVAGVCGMSVLLHGCWDLNSSPHGVHSKGSSPLSPLSCPSLRPGGSSMCQAVSNFLVSVPAIPRVVPMMTPPCNTTSPKTLP